MARPAPKGPLLGDELALAVETLTDRQFRAYQYRREGHALKWIGRRMGVSHPAVTQLIAKAERAMGYEPTYAAKKKTAYKSVATRREEADDVWDRQAVEGIHEMTRDERRRFIKAIDPGYPVKRLSEKEEIRLLALIYEIAASDEGATHRLKQRMAQVVRERRRAEREEEWLEPEEGKAEFEAGLEADFGMNSVTGDAMRASDFIEDDGRGYNRL